ncbi:MAG: hydrogenase maturation protease [bacterium]|nr:hydrogenase maturation protease [bacterium]
MPGARSLLILGLGNVICGDDGLGVVAVERLAREYELPTGVSALDGGTLGLSLLAHVTGAEDLLLVDAIRADAPAGTLVRLDGDDVAPAVRERLSVHQIGVADLLDALRLLGEVPRRMVLVGLVPETLELGLGCSPAVAAQLDELVAAVACEARALGHPLRRRTADETIPARGDRRALTALGL